MFKDAACTEYLTTGEYNTVYVRLNRDFRFGDAKSWGNGQGYETRVNIITPTDEFPNDPYVIYLYDDFWSDDFTSSFREGQVLECVSGDIVYLENPHVIFYDDGSSEVAP